MTALTIFTGLAPSLLRTVIDEATAELAAQEQATRQAARLQVAARMPEPVEAEPVPMPLAMVAEPGGLVEAVPVFPEHVAELVDVLIDAAKPDDVRCPSCQVKRCTMHRGDCVLMAATTPRKWTRDEDVALLEALATDGRILPVIAQLGRSQTDCLARFDLLVGSDQTRDARQSALRRALDAAKVAA